jgi:hypothetical protein
MRVLSPRVVATGLAVLGTLFSFGACGSNGGGETTSSLTKAQFLKQANAICARGTDEMGQGDAAFWKAHGGSKPNPSQALVNELQLTAILPVRKEELRRIRALGLPRGDEERVEKILLAWEEGVQKGEDKPRSLDVGGPEFAFYKAYTMGLEYGLEKCWLG